MTNTGIRLNDAYGVHRAVESVARDSYGRLLAIIAARSYDLAAAEDALGDAFHAALETWPTAGIPDRPEAWLLTAARRKLIDGARHARIVADAIQTLIAMAQEAEQTIDGDVVYPDERLKLLFLCAHPAIDVSVRTPLLLQTVLGLDAARIASAFLVQPTAMGQRLSRTKAKIRDARIKFDVPGSAELPLRLDAVLEAIYAAYGSGWDDVAGADARRNGLALEAIDLGRLLLQLMPAEPEAQGLLALMLYCESRRDARRGPSGEYVPLSDQDVLLWSRPMIAEADRLVVAASQAGRLGRFQFEAAIQSAHAQRSVTGITDWEAIAVMYEARVSLAPTIGAMVSHAAAVTEARGPAAGWELLETIPADAVKSYQPYWALTAHLLKRMGRANEAGNAYSRAIGLCEDQSMREFLKRQAPVESKRDRGLPD